MNQTLYNFIEAIALGWLDYRGQAKIVRKNGKIFDFVLEGELVQPHEIVTIENVADVLAELYNEEF
ncbi:hypothetical protein [uncultured Streptococcus sp.]|mgnify:CR=1 FL=1|uniref:competence regulator inhibitor paratox n=1 Tax=uncultured Streptococcus sp. TaxID=83427 RepID=UPI00205669D1|nr:hypothetical protein [uncultured Streptococcus sp.]DAF29789.1 MAG TPA: hypothetical protein [Caudoviricetes sp.]